MTAYRPDKGSLLGFTMLLLAVDSTGAQSRVQRAADEPMRHSVSDSTSHEPETMVVTASRTAQPLGDVPAAVTVLDGEEIMAAPSNYFSDLLRSVPGVNAAQITTFGASISTRSSTTLLPQGQLAMIDDRTIFQDLNGFVVWGAIPVEPQDIERIEVVRGPGSAVWGANAADGVIHIITKAPRDMVGTMVKVGGGELGTGYVAASHANVRGQWGYRITGGWHRQDAYDRPTGSIPGTDGPGNPGGTPYPTYRNEGTEAFRGNIRLDYNPDDVTTWSFSGGYAESDGITMTPGGPVLIESPSYSAHGQVTWTQGPTRATFFVNQDKATGAFLLGGAPGGFENQTYNLDLTDSRRVGARHALTYGANARYAVYDADVAPNGNDRDSYGVFLQDDISLADRLGLVAGARWDYIDPMGSAISPRVGLLFSPAERQTVRVSYNRAFLAPSMVENFLDLTTVNVVSIPDGQGGTLDLSFPLTASGNTGLDEEVLDAVELAWTGYLGDAIQASVAAYRNEFRDSIQLVVTNFYTRTNPPPNWPLDPTLLDVPPPDGFAGFPSNQATQNVGKVTFQGVEVGFQVQPAAAWSVFANYSWQDTPDVEGIDPVPLPNGKSHDVINTAPEHRVNLGASWSNGRFYGNGQVNYQSEAFWADILSPLYWGPTDAFTSVSAGVGVRLREGRVVLSVNGLNIFDADIQQHVFGDILRRRITSQVTFHF